MYRLRYATVGSVHIDIMADIYPDTQGVDRRGDITLSVGGTAFNVASALSILKGHIDFFSALKTDSLFTRLIIIKLKESGFTLYIQQKEMPDGGFVSLREGKDMILAVNSTPVEHVFIDAAMYGNILKKSDVFVIDLNNSIETVESFLKESLQHQKPEQKPVYILGVSEEKALKLLSFRDSESARNTRGIIKGIFLNRHEARNLLKTIGSTEYTDLCNIINTTWVVTADKYGVMIFSNKKLIRYVDTPGFNKVMSFEGSGDAFAGGFIYTHSLGGDIEMCIQNGFRLVGECAKNYHSNTIPGNTIEGVDNILFRDALTGLYSRAYFEEQIEYLSAVAKREKDIEKRLVSVIIFDLDKFKNINDTYGHAAGDEVLKFFGKLVASCVRKSDISARYGGEEIVVISPGISKSIACSVAKRIRKKLEEAAIPYNGTPIQVTVSAGVAGGYDDPRALLEKADKALYEAKKGGRNRVVYV